jgi:hypothetical protein
VAPIELEVMAEPLRSHLVPPQPAASDLAAQLTALTLRVGLLEAQMQAVARRRDRASWWRTQWTAFLVWCRGLKG